MCIVLVVCLPPSLPDGRGTVEYDIGYGGAFYALVSVQQFNLDLKTVPIGELLALAHSIFCGVKEVTKLTHPDSPDLAFLYGVILTDGRDTEDHSENICFFADRQVLYLLCSYKLTLF